MLTDKYFIQLKGRKLRCPTCEKLYSSSRHICREKTSNIWIDCSARGKRVRQQKVKVNRRKAIQLLLNQPTKDLNIYETFANHHVTNEIVKLVRYELC